MPSERKSIAARLTEEAALHRLDVDTSQQQCASRLDDLSIRVVQQAHSIRHKLRSQLSRLSARPRQAPLRGVYLWGDVGRGKTMLMDMFFDSLPAGLAERTHFYRFMRAVHAGLSDTKQRTAPLDAVAAKLAARIGVLCLDEFFVSDIADAMIIAGLFEGLFRRGVTLVATSNVAPHDLYREGLQRQQFLPAIQLLQQHLEIVHLDAGTDYRLRHLQRAPTYLDCALPDTAARLQQRFAALAGGTAAAPVRLSVEGRDIEARAAGAGLIWFEFHHICEGPRSQNDYIELARLYHTVFVSNIPVFSSGNENAARRFIMLIDEFYDRNVNIVVSAAAAPGALYRGERLQREFLRTASRLVEMQTQHYFARQHHP